jgi:hypothetical protein
MLSFNFIISLSLTVLPSRPWARRWDRRRGRVGNDLLGVPEAQGGRVQL